MTPLCAKSHGFRRSHLTPQVNRCHVAAIARKQEIIRRHTDTPTSVLDVSTCFMRSRPFMACDWLQCRRSARERRSYSKVRVGPLAGTSPRHATLPPKDRCAASCEALSAPRPRSPYGLVCCALSPTQCAVVTEAFFFSENDCWPSPTSVAPLDGVRRMCPAFDLCRV